MSAALDAARAALRDVPAWVVGGAVRDRLLGRDVGDVDVVVDGDVRRAARRVALEGGGPAFELSGTFGAWRVLAGDRSWQLDVMALQGASLEDDLARRDFTVNAIAEPLEGGELVDPHGGTADVERRLLRMVSPQAFDDDPLRVLRLARFASELALDVDPATRDAARERAPRIVQVAQERVFAELKRLVAGPDPVGGLALLDELGLTAFVLPELDGLRGVAQNRFHHRDVHGHTLEVLQAAVDLAADPGAVLGDAALGERVAAYLAEPLADELDRGGALRLGCLLHDAAKPQTRTDFGEGRVGFPGHDVQGADVAREALTRLRASEKLRGHVAALARHHLVLGFLVHEMPLGPREVHAYLERTAPVSADVTLLTVCDRLATRGDNAPRAIARHLELARVLLAAALDRRDAGRVAPLVRGDELAAELGIAPGPELGRLLRELEAARYAGEVRTREEAVAHARRALAGG
ncbi:HD domain-containing protein [Conexibacter sp. SYSU D00693]|uniref:HD domain-containing protein n=1 Tax=Conexibacter sp. SYSU D00693 TaxID=2812560 RepID=UPI00196ACDCC|nr:HD domain-containing protein [Conexibacter sp. SYSU D00693]